MNLLELLTPSIQMSWCPAPHCSSLPELVSVLAGSHLLSDAGEVLAEIKRGYGADAQTDCASAWER